VVEKGTARLEGKCLLFLPGPASTKIVVLHMLLPYRIEPSRHLLRSKKKRETSITATQDTQNLYIFSSKWAHQIEQNSPIHPFPANKLTSEQNYLTYRHRTKAAGASLRFFRHSSPNRHQEVSNSQPLLVP